MSPVAFLLHNDDGQSWYRRTQGYAEAPRLFHFRRIALCLDAKKPLGERPFCVSWWSSQDDFLNRLATPMPSRPSPSSAIVPGSVTDAALWLEKLAPDWL